MQLAGDEHEAVDVPGGVEGGAGEWRELHARPATRARKGDVTVEGPRLGRLAEACRRARHRGSNRVKASDREVQHPVTEASQCGSGTCGDRGGVSRRERAGYLLRIGLTEEPQRDMPVLGTGPAQAVDFGPRQRCYPRRDLFGRPDGD